MTAVDSRLYSAFDSYVHNVSKPTLSLSNDERLYLAAAFDELELIMQFAFEEGTDKIVVNLPSNEEFLAAIRPLDPIDSNVVLGIWQRIRKIIPTAEGFDRHFDIDEELPLHYLITFEQAHYIYRLASECNRLAKANNVKFIDGYMRNSI